MRKFRVHQQLCPGENQIGLWRKAEYLICCINLGSYMNGRDLGSRPVAGPQALSVSNRDPSVARGVLQAWN
jgi:hypothetical protein